MQKLLLISHSHRLDGGAELSLLSTLIAAKKRGITCHTILPKKGPFSEKLSSLGMQYSIQTYTWSAKSSKDSSERDTFVMANYNAEAIMQATETIEAHRPDAVIVNTIMIPWYGYAARALQVPCVLMARETLDEKNKQRLRPGYASYLHLLATTFDGILYNSSFLERTYQIEEPRFKTLHSDIYHPAITLSSEQKELTKNSTKLTNKPIKLLSIGALSPHKNQLSVVEALANLSEKERENYHLTITGSVADDNYKKHIEQFIAKEKLEQHVTFHDYTAKPLEHIQEHDCLIMSSNAEAFGRVTVEGMLLGRMVIGRNTGATPEIINHNKTGIVYESDQCKTLTDALRWLVEHKKEATQIAASAQRHAVAQYVEMDVFKPFFEMVKYITDNKNNEPSTHFYNPIYALVERNNDMNKHLQKYAKALQEASEKITKLEQEANRQKIKPAIKKLLGRN